MEWRKVKLGDILNFRRGHDLPHAEMRGGDIPVAGSNGCIGYHNEATPIAPIITIGRSGNIGTPYYYDKAWAHNTTLYIDDFKGNNPKYLYYLLKTLPLASFKGGSAVPTLNRNHIHPLEVLHIDDIQAQSKIVAILSSLDDKIENNNRVNANLEAQVQALFKRWFVDFGPAGGVMPKNWKETTIGEVCKCYLGGTPSRSKAEYWNGNIPWINSGEVNKYRILDGSEYITELGLQKSATKLLPKKTTVLAITGATLGQVSLLEIDACANQSVIGIVQNEKVPYEFIYPLIKNDIEQIMLHQTGGAQQHINKDNVESHKIIFPSDDIMTLYKALQAPLFESIANNCFENQRLAVMRDTLLPKLMKGEIEL